MVALYLLAAVEITSLLRRRIPTRWWRVIHLSSFVLFAAGTIHLLTAGTDAANPWVLAAVGIAVTTVVYLTTVRLLTPRRRTKRTTHPPARIARPDTPRRAHHGPMAGEAPTGATAITAASHRPTIRSGT